MIFRNLGVLLIGSNSVIFMVPEVTCISPPSNAGAWSYPIHRVRPVRSLFLHNLRGQLFEGRLFGGRETFFTRSRSTRASGMTQRR